ncbi:MAG: hypothetical protein IJP92_03285 [Lachnospiraceae bacterium]|nr:hypothetical protein [Lachnospiraceae bacterium]
MMIKIIELLLQAFGAIQGYVKNRKMKFLLTILIILGVIIIIILIVMQRSGEGQDANQSVILDSENNIYQNELGDDDKAVDSSDNDLLQESDERVDTEVLEEEEQYSIKIVKEDAYILLNDMYRIEESKIYIDSSAVTTWGDNWLNCMRFGSSNLNVDGNAYISLPTKCEYTRFTAEIAAEDGFDSSETVTLTIYGQDEEENYLDLGTYEIGRYTKPFSIDFDISSCDILIICKNGDYNMGRIAGQYLNEYTGMSVLIRDGKLYKKE